MENELYIFDELCRNVVAGVVSISKVDTDKLNRSIGNCHIATEVERRVKVMSEDIFQENLDREHFGQAVAAKLWISAQLNFTPSSPVKIMGLGVGEMVVDQDDEGGGFEQSIHQLVNNYYERNCFRSPYFYRQTMKKELTDILALAPTHTVFIESKAIQMLNREKELTTDRMIKNMEKNIEKAISQLGGAVRTVRSNERIYYADDKEILAGQINKENVHCVVLISEMHPNINWEAIYNKIIQFTNSHAAFLHVMDLNELFRNLVLSRSTETFMLNLLNRWDHVYDNRTAFVRALYKPSGDMSRG